MATLVIPENNSTTNLTGQITNGSNFLPELWKRGVKLSEATENFFESFEGPTENYAIQSIRDLSRGAGTKITFRSMSHIYGEGVQGDDLINDATEDFRVGAFNLSVDFLRHAISYNRRTEENTALASELKSNVPVLLGSWLGRIKTERLFKMFQHKGGSINSRNINNRASVDDIVSNDSISYSGILENGQALRTLGAKPATIGTVNKNKINRFVVVGTGDGLFTLKNETKYLDAIKAYTASVGADSVFFTGGFTDLDGHAIRQYDPFDHDGYGAVGSSLNPKALLGETFTINSGTAAAADITIKGGGTGYANAPTNAKANKFFKFFDRYTYKFGPSDSVTVNSTSSLNGSAYSYVLILSGGKYGLYQYSVNNGNKLTMTAALVPSSGVTSGAFNRLVATSNTWATLVGSTAPTGWAAAFADSKLTNTHAIGDPVVQCNAWGVPIGRSLLLGSNAAVRGYGSLDGDRSEETFDGDFVRKVYITSIFGQAPYERVDGVKPNYLQLTHSISVPGLTIPLIG